MIPTSLRAGNPGVIGSIESMSSLMHTLRLRRPPGVVSDEFHCACFVRRSFIVGRDSHRRWRGRSTYKQLESIADAAVSSSSTFSHSCTTTNHSSSFIHLFNTCISIIIQTCLPLLNPSPWISFNPPNKSNFSMPSTNYETKA